MLLEPYNMEYKSIGTNIIIPPEKRFPDTLYTDFDITDQIENLPFFNHPVRQECMMFAFCLEGYLDISIHHERKVITESHFFGSCPHHIVTLNEVSEDFKGYFICMSKRFLEDIRIDFKNGLSIYFYFKDHPATRLTEQEIETLKTYFSLLSKKKQEKESDLYHSITLHLINALFFEVNHILTQYHEQEKIKKTRREELFEQFMFLIEKHFMKERSIGFYAEKMFLTPKYLSSIIKEISGKHAGDWIDETIIMEAKTLLKCSGLNIQQIAEALNFANQSFFGKYFKHHTGFSPTQYKNM